MRRRGARECEEALMEAAEARRGYTRVAAWDEGNLIQAMARLKNPTIAWRKRDDTGMDDTRDRAPTYYPPPLPRRSLIYVICVRFDTLTLPRAVEGLLLSLISYRTYIPKQL